MIMYQDIEHRAIAPAEELAREWALFQAVDSGHSLSAHHIWEAPRPVVVVGRSTSIPDHVILESCREDGVEIVRRFSGGGAVVLGPGCLNYAVVVSLVSRPDLTDVRGSFSAILGQIAAALRMSGVSVDGGTDLVLDGRKISGNAQRRGRQALIHHGTLLYDFDAGLAGRYLKEPSKQPAYRRGRVHAEFMGNLGGSRHGLWDRLRAGLEDVVNSQLPTPNSQTEPLERPG